MGKLLDISIKLFNTELPKYFGLDNTKTVNPVCNVHSESILPVLQLANK